MHNTAQVPLFNQPPMTRIRIAAARVLYYILHAALRGDRHRIQRGGIYYDADLSEGFDLSIFLFRHLQSHETDTQHFTLRPDAVILDVGANFGILSLRFAQLAPQGKVYAFEPTGYAFEKLARNLALNPGLARRIAPIQTFISDTSTQAHHITAYSSWKVDAQPTGAHPVHGGLIQAADGVGAIAVDDFGQEHQIERVDFIKIDTDGHEYWGAQATRKTLE
jgi:FkbM family methyltransferase